MDQSGCGVGRLNIITPQEGSTLELELVCVCVCKHVSNLHRPAFTSHTQIFTPVQLLLCKRKLWLGHRECISYVFARCVYVSMCERTACARICVQEGRTGDPSGTTLSNNGSFLPPKCLTGLSVLEQPHTNTGSQTGNAQTHARPRAHMQTQRGAPVRRFIWELFRGIQQGSVFS